MKRHRLPALVMSSTLTVSCATAGSAWMAEPLAVEDQKAPLNELPPREPAPRAAPASAARTRIIGERVQGEASEEGSSEAMNARVAASGGRSLGTFRNTYYDFPSEADFDMTAAGDQKVSLKNARCESVAQVARGFFESLCVQGSGALQKGATVSFAKRDCGCAEVCPRTNQRICFDLLDVAAFPWGRGATGKAITPLLTVAVDSDVIPLGTALYVPELDGLPRDASSKAVHDGCFIAEDRGIRVKGKHLDVFTGHSRVTALWNRLVPSNQGVTVIVESARCARGG